MIVATLPEPTVLPPSRYLNSIFCGIFYAFYCGKQRKIAVFVWHIFICMISWHRFGTKMIFSLSPLLHGASTMYFLSLKENHRSSYKITKEICIISLPHIPSNAFAHFHPIFQTFHIPQSAIHTSS